jgi:hypothetical protein
LGGELFLLFVPMLVTLSCQFAVNVVWVAEDSWTSKTAMQEARYGHGVVVVNRKIYAIGGQTARAQLSQFSCLTNEVPRMSSSQHNYIQSSPHGLFCHYLC